MNILTKLQANTMFRDTDKHLLTFSFPPDCHSENDIDNGMMEMLRYFHCREVYRLDLDDEYFKGIRANTFCIEVGWSELYTDYENEQLHPTIYIVTANHKGTRMLTMHAIEENQGAT